MPPIRDGGAMRIGLFSLLTLWVAGCASTTQWELLHREVRRTIADVTLVAGLPDRVADLPGGRRVYQWDRAHLVPRGGGRCTYELMAVLEGRLQSLAAWRVVAIKAPEPGCEPLAEGFNLIG